MHSQFDDSGLPAAVAEASYSATIEVNVTDNVGRPVAEAFVTVDDGVPYAANESGRLTITEVLADTNGTKYNLSAQCDGYLELGEVSVTVTPYNTTWVNLTVKGGAIYGTVTENWEPVVGANISLDDRGLNTTSGTDGGYLIDGLKSGAYSVTATAPNHDPLTKVVPTLSVGGLFRLDFALSLLTGSISGTVLHATTQDPVEGANVSVRVESVPPVTITVMTEADGSYYFPNVPAGTYTVTASLTGFNTSTLSDIEVVSGENTTGVDILLEERRTKLWGIVRSGTVLLVGANVSVWGTDFGGQSSIEGKYEIDGIPAGVYTVEASLQGYVNVTIPGVEIARGSELQLNFNLTGLPGALYGVVIDDTTGAPLSGVNVLLLPQRETLTNINGEFAFTGLKEGNYTIRVMLDGFRPMEIGPIVITHEETVYLDDVHLEPTRGSFGGFIFGFDLAHSMMILALFLTIVILALAVVLRIRTFEAPDKAPAIYDELYEEDEDEAEDKKKGKTASKTDSGVDRTNEEE